MTLARLLQLLDLRRTIRLERDLDRLSASSRALAGAAERLARTVVLPRRQPVPVLRVAIRADLLEIQTLLATGRVADAKAAIDSLVTAVETGGVDAKSAS